MRHLLPWPFFSKKKVPHAATTAEIRWVQLLNGSAKPKISMFMILGYFNRGQTGKVDEFRPYWQLTNSISVPVVFSGEASLATPQFVENVNVTGPVGAPAPVNVVEIDPDVGKQQVASDHVTALNVLVALYWARL